MPAVYMDATWKWGERLLILYLGTAPVYWLPGFSTGQFRIVKFALVAGAVGLLWTNAWLRDRRLLPGGIVGPLGLFMLLAAAAPGFLQARDMSVVLDNAIDLTLGFVVLWTMAIAVRSGADVHRIIGYSALLLLMCALPGLMNWLVGFPSWRPPFKTIDLATGGLGAKRTGWSTALSLYVPMVAVQAAFFLRARQVRVLLPLGFAGIILLSQYATGGRGGLIASVVGLATLSLIVLPKRFTGLAAGGFLFAAAFVVRDATRHLRLGRITGWDFETLNHFSAYRLEQYREAITLFWERPLTGYGFEMGREMLYLNTGLNMDIHNVWLRLMVEGGLFLALVFAVLAFLLIERARRSLDFVTLRQIRAGTRIPRAVVQHNVFTAGILSVLLAGIVFSQFEPNALVGSFQNEVFWWACGGVAIGYAPTIRDYRMQD